MKRTVTGFLVAVMLMAGTAFAQPEEEHGILGKIGDGALVVWNLVPKAVEVVNDGLHFVCGKVHDGVHSVSNFLHVENLP